MEAYTHPSITTSSINVRGMVNFLRTVNMGKLCFERQRETERNEIPAYASRELFSLSPLAILSSA